MTTATRQRRRPFLAALTFLAVAGIASVSVIPAYGFERSYDPGEPVAPIASAKLTLDVDEGLAAAASIRGVYSSQSLASIRAEQEAAERAAAEAAAAAYRAAYAATPRAPGDDYPYRGMVGMSPLRYEMGQCTDFVAWRLNRDIGAPPGGPYPWDWGVLTPGGGDGSQWLYRWLEHGWPVSEIPVPGAVAYWTDDNHVGYVEAVNADGSIIIEDYNRVASEQYGRELFTSYGNLLFLYPPPH